MRRNDLRHNPYVETKEREKLVDIYATYLAYMVVAILIATVTSLVLKKGGLL